MRPAMAQCKVLGGLLLHWPVEEEEEGRGGWKEEEEGKRCEGSSSSAERVAGKEGRRRRTRSLLLMPVLGPAIRLLLLGSSIMVFAFDVLWSVLACVCVAASLQMSGGDLAAQRQRFRCVRTTSAVRR